MTRARGWAAPLAAAVAVVLAVPLLAGCEAAQQAQQGVDKAADCAGLVGELTGIHWSDVQQACLLYTSPSPRDTR